MSIGETPYPTESSAGSAGNLDKDRRAFVRWSFCAVIVILMHGLIGSLLLRWQKDANAVEPTATIVIELSPLVAAPQVKELPTPPVPWQIEAENPSERVIERDVDEERK